MEVVKLQILDGFLLPSLPLSEMRHLMLWIFLPLSRLLTAAAKFPASSFLLHDDNGLTDDLKIGPYQELLEQRSESERAADMRARGGRGCRRGARGMAWPSVQGRGFL